MGHNLRAIIAKSGVLTPVANAWIHAETIELTQGFSLIKVTDLLLDDINELINVKQNDPYDEFDDLTGSLHQLLLDESEKQRSLLAYIETDYFGGVGTQTAILYENGVSHKPLKTESKWDQENYCHSHEPIGIWAINTVLQKMGVICAGEKDEFDSIRLGWYRKTDN